MKDISLTKKYTQGINHALTVVNNLAIEMYNKHGIGYTWLGDTVKFANGDNSITGKIVVKESEVRVKIHCEGFFIEAMAPVIESQVKQNFQTHFGA